MSLLSKPITVVHTSSTSVDSSGRPTRVTTSTATTAGYRHRLASDTFDGQLVVIDEVTFYVPPATVIAIGDSITLDGDNYEVVSDPFPSFNHRSATVHHLAVRGRKKVR